MQSAVSVGSILDLEEAVTRALTLGEGAAESKTIEKNTNHIVNNNCNSNNY